MYDQLPILNYFQQSFSVDYKYATIFASKNMENFIPLHDLTLKRKH